MKLGLLHPGAMGAAIGACFQSAGHTVFWLPEGRSAASIERAKRAALRACDTLDQLLSEVDLVISICPPDAADRLIDSVIAANYSGRFMDANAVSPQRLLAMQERSQATKMTLVDGSIIGLPIWPEARRRQTTLHLSGPETAALAEALQGSPLKVNHVSERLGDASALKMTFAAFSKGSAALTAEIQNVAQQYGVAEALAEQLGDITLAQWQNSLKATAVKAWRFSGEMQEIADTFEAVSAEPGFHQAASRVYQKLSRFKDAPDPLDLDDLLNALINPPNS